MPNVRVVTSRPHRLLHPLIQEIGQLNQDNQTCVLLVPEQLTLQAERELIYRLNRNGLISIEVISPTRLKFRVMAAVGADERIPLSAAGQQMAVSFAMEACGETLTYYQASVTRHGFSQKLCALISDMKHGGLQPDELKAYAETLPDGMHKEKFKDLALLYEAYQQILQDRMGDSDDYNQLISSRIGESGLLRGKHVFVYGFDAMTEQLIVLLCAIAGDARSLTVGLISDGSGASDQELYLPVRQSIARFRAALAEKGIALSEVQLPSQPLAHAPAIAYLDAMLYAFPQKVFSGEQSAVVLSQFNSPFEEATMAMRQIMRLYEQGTPLESIAVMYPEQNGYPFAVAAALENSGLPYYTDEKLSALSHGLAQFLLSAMRAISGGYRSDDIFAMMKSGYAPISFEDACTLENYAREFGINYNRWLKPFRKGDELVCTHCEELRKAIIRPLITAHDAIVAARETNQSLQAVMNLLTDVDAYNTLKQEEDALLRENMLVRAGQNSQVWQKLLELFDQLYSLADGERIPLKYIAERFESGFAAINLASLPPAAHMLHAGVLGHTLSGETDVVFLLGMNDGILSRSSESLLTEEERALAQEHTQTYLGLTEESRLLFARLDIKRAMTLPKERLYISYAKTDPEGKPLQPLDLVSDMEERLFEALPELPEISDTLPVSAQQALAALSDLLRKYTDGAEEQLPSIWMQRVAALLSSAQTAIPTMQLLRAVGFRAETLPLPAALAQRLFGDRALSVSRLEDYAACPFRHYITYGLCPEERKEWTVTPIETGNFFHNSLQRFAQIAQEHPRFPHIDKEEIHAMALAAAEPLMEELKNGPMGDGPRSMAALAQAARIVDRACSAVTDHIAAGEFALDRSEAKFGYPGTDSFPPVSLSLPDGTEITLHGRIDRIDSYQTDDGLYRRVIDYKSGSYAALDAAELWHGMQLQLMLYLDAVTANTGKAKPAGAFYFHLFDPMSKVDSGNAEAVSQDIQKQLQMNGIALSEPAVLHAMDSGDQSIAIPAAVTQNGGLRKNAKVMDRDHLDALMDHAKGKATQFSAQMLAGDISVKPVKHGRKESCTYCEYRPVCGYDPFMPGAQGSEIFNMTLEELTEKLDQAKEQ